MSWKDFLFQAFVGFLEILGNIAKVLGKILVTLIRVWEPICCAGLFFILGCGIGKLLGLAKGPLTELVNYNSFIAIMTILGLAFGSALATRRLRKKE